MHCGVTYLGSGVCLDDIREKRCLIGSSGNSKQNNPGYSPSGTPDSFTQRSMFHSGMAMNQLSLLGTFSLIPHFLLLLPVSTGPLLSKAQVTMRTQAASGNNAASMRKTQPHFSLTTHTDIL